MLLGRKAVINLDSVLKRRDITLLTKDCNVKTMVLDPNTKELMLSNCGAGEESWQSLRKQGDQNTQS